MPTAAITTNRSLTPQPSESRYTCNTLSSIVRSTNLVLANKQKKPIIHTHIRIQHSFLPNLSTYLIRVPQ